MNYRMLKVCALFFLVFSGNLQAISLDLSLFTRENSVKLAKYTAVAGVGIGLLYLGYRFVNDVMIDMYIYCIFSDKRKLSNKADRFMTWMENSLPLTKKEKLKKLLLRYENSGLEKGQILIEIRNILAQRKNS